MAGESSAQPNGSLSRNQQSRLSRHHSPSRHQSLKDSLQSLSQPRTSSQRHPSLKDSLQSPVSATNLQPAPPESQGSHQVPESATHLQPDHPNQPTLSLIDGWCMECNTHHIPNKQGQTRFENDAHCPKTQPKTMPILLIGDSGTGNQSRIGGHCRRGGKKMRQEHTKHCVVGNHKRIPHLQDLLRVLSRAASCPLPANRSWPDQDGE